MLGRRKASLVGPEQPGRYLLTHDEEAEGRVAAEARIEQENQARIAAEARIQELEAELRRRDGP